MAGGAVALLEELDRAPFEICGNQTDDDGDGSVDESECQVSATSAPVSQERGITPELWAGNPDCGDLGFELGLKVDAPFTSTRYYFDSDEYVDLVVDPDGKLIDWDSTVRLDAVFLKASSGGNLYVYDPEVGSDTQLGTPDLAHQISHVSFCYDLGDDLCADVTCPPPAGDCFEEGVCDPDTGECTYATRPEGTACGDSSDTVCDNPDTCDGAGACLPNHESVTVLCREDAGECDVPEYCDAMGSCPADGFEPPGATCGDPSDSVCDNPDTCDGGGFCSRNHEPITTLCREDAGECDVPEYCDLLGSCPANGFEPPGTSCGDPSDTVCDNPDTCDSVGACTPNWEPVTMVCREDSGECDVPELCDGTGNCPANGFEPPGTSCGDGADTVCDNPDTCDAAGSCLENHEPTTVVCRTSEGNCDLPEQCGADGTCPADEFKPAGTLCRAVADVCDVEEVCTGLEATCPPNGFEPEGTECRPSVDECDPAEECTGTRAACPTDVYATCTLCGQKFYDANADAAYSAEELGIGGWQLTLTGGGGTTTTLSENGGGFEFAGLAAGDYTLCESMPNEDNWMQTAPEEVCYTVHVPLDDGGQCLLDFGNLCLGAGGGHTPGFWSNQNGRAAFMDGDGGAAALALVVSLDLWNADGSAFNPASYSAFRTWLMGRTATNAAYMLSAHAAAMELNVLRGYVSPDALIFAPNLQSSDGLGFATVQAVLDEARAELALHGYTPAGNPHRAYQLALERALSDANDNDNFVQPEACPHTFD